MYLAYDLFKRYNTKKHLLRSYLKIALATQTTTGENYQKCKNSHMAVLLLSDEVEYYSFSTLI
jgi:hypothetical protein